MRDVVNNKPEEVYNKATSGKGQNIWSEYSEQKSKLEASKKTVNGTKNVSKNRELKTEQNQIKQKGLN